MGIIPPQKPRNRSDSERSKNIDDDENYSVDLDAMSNFSLEIEMLNKLHVEKNNLNNLACLPIVYHDLLPEPDMSLYREIYDSENRMVWILDDRPRIHFKDPITKTVNSMRRSSDKNAFYYEEVSGIQNADGRKREVLQLGLGGVSGQRKYSSVAATGLGDEEYNHYNNCQFHAANEHIHNPNVGDELCLRMDNKYFESSDEEGGAHHHAISSISQNDNSGINRYK